MAPTIGTTVIYNTTEEERKEMEQSNHCNVSEKLPAVIVAVFSEECVNLKVNLDGTGDLWKTSVQKGDKECNWAFPVTKE